MKARPTTAWAIVSPKGTPLPDTCSRKQCLAWFYASEETDKFKRTLAKAGYTCQRVRIEPVE